jgi:hypothetical protein
MSPFALVFGIIAAIVAANACYVWQADVYCVASDRQIDGPDRNDLGVSKSESKRTRWERTSMQGAQSLVDTDLGDDGKNAQSAWHTKFFCEVKASDLALADLTLGLMLATLWLVYYTMRLWKSGEAQLEVARQSASLAEASARTAANAATTAQRTFDHARAAERPYIFVRITEDNLATLRPGSDPRSLVVGDFSILYELGNEGRTPAILLSMAHAMRWSRVRPDWTDCEKQEVLPVDRFLVVSKWSRPIRCVARGSLLSKDVESIERTELSLWFLGYFEFQDSFGSRARSQYVWRYDGATGGKFALAHFKQEIVHQPNRKRQSAGATM